MAEYIFDILVCLIRHFGKHSKRSDIYKIITVKRADITRIGVVLYDTLCRVRHPFRDLQAVCKIVCASCRDIADRASDLTVHHAGHHFIQCPVTAAAGDKIKLCSPFLHNSARILWFLRHIERDIQPSFDKNICDIQQCISDLSFSGSWIHNK